MTAADTGALLRPLVTALMVEQAYHRVAMPDGWADQSLWRERGTTARVREMVGLGDFAGQQDVRFVSGYRGMLDQRVGEKVRGLDVPDLQALAANLIAYTVRERSEAEEFEPVYVGEQDDGEGIEE